MWNALVRVYVTPECIHEFVHVVNHLSYVIHDLLQDR